MIVAILPGGTRQTFRTADAYLAWHRTSAPAEPYAVAELKIAPTSSGALERVGPSS